MKNQLFHNSFLVLFIFVIAACGGSGSNDNDNDEANIGWVEIDSYSVNLNADAVPYARVRGKAFINNSYTSHQCSGFCCLLCLFDNSYPGVSVSSGNQTNNLTGTTISRYGTLTSWEHLWSASIPLTNGINSIVINAIDSAGNHGTDSINFEYLPPGPINITTNSGNAQIIIEWGNITGADSYNIYWGTIEGVTKSSGHKITNVTSPYAHSSLVNGSIYYYVLTSVFGGVESIESREISAVPGAPERPDGVVANTSAGDVVITWNDVATVVTYNLYWANEPSVTKNTSIKINGVSSPYIHTGLVGIPYYYIVTAVNSYGESSESVEATAKPQLPPPAPTGINATTRYVYDLNFSYSIIDVAWDDMPEVNYFNLYRCRSAWDTSVFPPEVADLCTVNWGQIYTGAGVLYSDSDVDSGHAYLYRVTAVNDFGESGPSQKFGIGAL